MILVTIAENDKYFMKTIGLDFKGNNSVTLDMSEDNIDKVKQYLPEKYKHNVIIRLDLVKEVITVEE